ncbi:MAG: hypothetical protein WD226_08790 [Planctomycetota bacterium]
MSLLSGALGAQSSSDDPFAPGDRWQWSSDVSAPWIPRSVRYVGEGEWVLAAPSVGASGVALLASADTSGAPLHLAFDWTGSTGAIEVRSAGPPRGLFALGGFPGAAGGRSYELRRYDGEAAARGAAFAPVWTRDLGFQGRVLFEADSVGRVVRAAESATASRIDVTWTDATTGADLVSVPLTGTNLRAFSLSADGSRAAVSSSGVVRVLDGTGVIGSWGTTGSRAALDDSGTKLAYADGAFVRVAMDHGTGFQSAFDLAATGPEVGGKLTWSADGSTLAIAWWNPATTDVRVSVHDTQGALLFEGSQSGGAWQNYPAGLALSANGERLVVGTWGAADGGPELFLIDVPQQLVLMARDLGGSVEDLDLAPDGTRVVVAYKAGHANQLIATGAVEHFDTGERDFVLTSATRVGGSLTASLELAAPGLGVFALGIEAATPWLYPGLGTMFLEPSAPILWADGIPDGPTRARLDVSIPNSSAVVGLPWLLQAGGVTAQGPFLADSVLRPRVL